MVDGLCPIKGRMATIEDLDEVIFRGEICTFLKEQLKSQHLGEESIVSLRKAYEGMNRKTILSTSAIRNPMHHAS